MLNRSHFIALLVVGLIASSAAAALAFTPDEEFLVRKGYSPMTAQTVNNYRSLTEWKGAAPARRGPAMQLWYNIIHNDPIGYLDEDGYSVIRRI